MADLIFIGLFCVAIGLLGWVHDRRATKARRPQLLPDDRARARAEGVVRYYREVGDSVTG